MKRVLYIAILALAALSLASAQGAYSPLEPRSAKNMALGGAFTAIPTAEMSFFGNPAAFAAKRGSLTIASADAWAYVKPSNETQTALINILSSANPNPLSILGVVMPTNGGIGAGASAGLGWAGGGLGLGLFAVTDEFAAGSSLPEAVLYSDTQLNAVIGLGVPIINVDGFRLVVGGDLRPFYRLRTETSLATVIRQATDPNDTDPDKVDKAVQSIPVSSGFGLALDIGATLQLGSITIGISSRDLSPSFPMWNGTLGDLITSLDETGSLPQPAEESIASFLPNISAGLAWQPRLLPGVIDPSLYIEIKDPIGVIKEDKSALNLLHAGAELRLLSFIYLRGGINRGWLSAGAGVKLFFIDVNAAVFTEELGVLPGDKPRSGVAVQAAIRF
jgi:hypothetical protein